MKYLVIIISIFLSLFTANTHAAKPDDIRQVRVLTAYSIYSKNATGGYYKTSLKLKQANTSFNSALKNDSNLQVKFINYEAPKTYNQVAYSKHEAHLNWLIYQKHHTARLIINKAKRVHAHSIYMVVDTQLGDYGWGVVDKIGGKYAIGSLDSLIMAHEIGHNMGATHEDGVCAKINNAVYYSSIMARGTSVCPWSLNPISTSKYSTYKKGGWFNINKYYTRTRVQFKGNAANSLKKGYLPLIKSKF